MLVSIGCEAFTVKVIATGDRDGLWTSVY
jgi:hypothetical protein